MKSKRSTLCYLTTFIIHHSFTHISTLVIEEDSFSSVTTAADWSNSTGIRRLNRLIESNSRKYLNVK